MKCQQFFQLEPTTKASINVHKGPRPQRGYGGVGGESFKHLGLDGTGDDYVDVKVREPSWSKGSLTSS